MSAYCAAADAYRFVPPGILKNPGRLVWAVSTSTETMTLDGHGFALNQPLLFRAESGGSLPSPLAAGTTYYAIPLTESTFQVAASSGGAAINLTTAGSNVIAIAPFQWDEWIIECSAMVEQTLPAHVVPIESTVPEPVRLYTACLLAMRALAHVGAQTQAVQVQLDFWGKQADKWARGVPLRGANVPASANLAVTRSASQVDPRGWDSPGGRLP